MRLGTESRGASDRAANDRPWLVPLSSPTTAARRSRLICCPHAGGSASLFGRWAERLDSDVELWAVAPPGRGPRLDEPPASTIDAWAEGILSSWPFEPGDEVALFGHSMGAVVAFEVASRLEDRHDSAVGLLAVSARAAPGRRPDGDEPRMSALDGPAMLAALRRRYGEADAALREPDIAAMAVPALRADIAALEVYDPATRPPLRCPVTAFGAIKDRSVSRAELDAWREVTTGSFRLHMLLGGHFTAMQRPESLLSLLRARLP